MPELRGLVVLRQKKRDNFKQGKPGNLSSATFLKCVQLENHTNFILTKNTWHFDTTRSEPRSKFSAALGTAKV